MAPKGKGGGGGRATAVVEESNKTADGVARYTRPTSRKNLSTQLRTAATPLNLICFWPWLRGCPPCSCFSWSFGLPAPSPWGAVPADTAVPSSLICWFSFNQFSLFLLFVPFCPLLCPFYFFWVPLGDMEAMRSVCTPSSDTAVGTGQTRQQRI